ncbi:MAG: hypothetical protein GXP44_00010 [bacterium]|nr:hypothetical protein [bacterium]
MYNNMTFDAGTLVWMVPLVVWSVVWKGVGLWKSAKNNQLKWFIAIFALNTLGILPIIYIKFFQKKPSAD